MTDVSIKLKSNIVFFLLVVIGISNFLLIVYSVNTYFSNFISQAWLLLNLKGAFEFLVELCTSQNLFLTTVIVLFTSYQIIRVFFALVKTLFDYFLVKKFIKNTFLKSEQEYILLDNNNDEVFTFGFFNPKIYISKSIFKKLTAEQIKVILLHEKAHIQNYDFIKKIIVDFIKYSLVKFPYKTKIFSNYSTLAELSADSYVQNKIGSLRPLLDSLYEYMKIRVQNKERYNLLGFGLAKANRLNILIGKENFEVKSLVYSLIITIFFIASINVAFSAVSPTNTQCMVRDMDIEQKEEVVYEENFSSPCLQTYDLKTSYCINVPK